MVMRLPHPPSLASYRHHLHLQLWSAYSWTFLSKLSRRYSQPRQRRPHPHVVPSTHRPAHISTTMDEAENVDYEPGQAPLRSPLKLPQPTFNHKTRRPIKNQCKLTANRP